MIYLLVYVLEGLSNLFLNHIKKVSHFIFSCCSIIFYTLYILSRFLKNATTQVGTESTHKFVISAFYFLFLF